MPPDLSESFALWYLPWSKIKAIVVQRCSQEETNLSDEKIHPEFRTLAYKSLPEWVSGGKRGDMRELTV